MQEGDVTESKRLVQTIAKDTSMMRKGPSGWFPSRRVAIEAAEGDAHTILDVMLGFFDVSSRVNQAAAGTWEVRPV